MKYAEIRQKETGSSTVFITPSCQISISTIQEFQEKYPDIYFREISHCDLGSFRFCKAECLGDTVTGTFVIPQKENPSGKKKRFGYCMLPGQLIFIDDQDNVKTILNEMQSIQNTNKMSELLFLFDFMEYLLRDDMIFLEQYDDKLNKLEEKLLGHSTEDFDRKILSIRKDLSTLGNYYEQLSDMGEILQQYAAEQEKEREGMLFGLYAERAGRIYGTVQMLKEYSMQLREIHQTQVDMHQNEIMKFLTIVTTIFMPLTLVAGWYGMNFINMPELKKPFGYAAVCVVCIVMIIIEILILKKKKWF